jgi:spermidine synthase
MGRKEVCNKRKTILFLILLSGISALIYEVVWIRMFILVFGVSIYAVSTVLSAFMAGLALGSFVFGRMADRHKNMLAIYTFLELGIGVSALAFSSVLSGVTSLYISLYQQLHTFSFFYPLLFLLSFFILLIPATFMGATLPVVSKLFAKREEEIGREIGLLYSVNTIGGVIGTFFTTFFLVEKLGISGTIYFAAALNFIVSGTAFFLARGSGDMTSKPPEFKTKITQKSALVLLVFSVSGFTALAFEVVWTRVLTLIYINTIYSFSTILIAFLCGLALGSKMLSKRIDSSRNPILLFAIVEMSIGALVIFLSPAFAVLTTASDFFFLSQWEVTMLAEFATSFALMLPVTFLFGATFPLASRICTKDVQRVGSMVGLVYSSNTVGAVFGSFFAGFILIPSLGLQKGMLFLAVLNILLAYLLLSIAGVKKITKSIFAIAGIAMVIAAISYPQAMYLSVRGDEKILYYSEGVTSTVSVHLLSGGVKELKVDGIDVAGAGPGTGGAHFMETQKLQAHIPLLMSKNPRNVLIIGFGSGGTSYSSTLHGAQVEDAELSSNVLDAAVYFEESNHDVLNASNYRATVADGRNYLLTTPKKYDVILSESVHPAYYGNSNLYTKDFFELARSKLNDSGVFSIWIPFWRMSEGDIKMIIKSFLEVFPNAALWDTNVVSGSRNSILVGIKSEERKWTTNSSLGERMKGVAGDLSEVNVNSTSDLLALFLVGKNLTNYAGDSPINTDGNPLLEFSTPRWINKDRWEEVRNNILHFRDNVSEIVDGR